MNLHTLWTMTNELNKAYKNTLNISEHQTLEDFLSYG